MNEDTRSDNVLVADRRLQEIVANDVAKNGGLTTKPRSEWPVNEDTGKKYNPDLEIQEVFVVDSKDRVLTEKEITQEALRYSMRCFDPKFVHDEKNNNPKQDSSKFMYISDRSLVAEEPQQLNLFGPVEKTNSLADLEVVTPPYPPELLSKFLEVDATHFRCVKTKVSDSVLREYSILPNTMPVDKIFDPSKITTAEKKKVDNEVMRVRQFMQECNEVIQWDGVTERASMDHESVGWGAVEVIRSRDMMAAQIAHVPAARLRVLRGWGGFVEIQGPDEFVFYQNFGEKVLSNRTGPGGKKLPYNPRLDGPPTSKLTWNLIDKDTGKPTDSFENSASELIFIPKHHSNSIYYGIPDHVPALGDIIGNINIRDYFNNVFA